MRLLSNKLPKGKYLSCKDILTNLQTNFLDGHHYGDKETKDNIINTTHIASSTTEKSSNGGE